MIDLAMVLPIGLVHPDLTLGNDIGHHGDMARAEAALDSAEHDHRILDRRSLTRA